MAKTMAWAFLALFMAAAALPAVDAASDGLGTLDQVLKAGGERDATLMIYVPCGIAVLFAVFLWVRVSAIKVERPGPDCIASEASFIELKNCYQTIQIGAKAFLKAEYTVCTAFVLVFGGVVLVLCSRVPNLTATQVTEPYVWKWKVGALTMASFFVGAFTSMAAGYIGMMVAVFANAKTTVAALKDGPAGNCYDFPQPLFPSHNPCDFPRPPFLSIRNRENCQLTNRKRKHRWVVNPLQYWNSQIDKLPDRRWMNPQIV